MSVEGQTGCFTGMLGPLRRKLRARGGSPDDRDLIQQLNACPEVETKHMHFASCCDFGVEEKLESRARVPLDNPPSYSLTDSAPYRVEVLRTIDSTIGDLSPILREINLQIHDHPELMFQEKCAHDTLAAFMSDHGFTVTKHYLGLDTAWRAEWSNGSGGRVLGINSEMDALPGIGHACGHNLIAMAGVGVALAVKSAMQQHDVIGKIVLLGTPAEEGGGGKVILLERGGYDGMDACVMCHPGPGPERSTAIGSTLSMQEIDIEFFGHPAHAAAAPWEGINALDAAVLAYSAVSALRQQIKPDHRVHGVIKGGDQLAANVIPDYVKMQWYVRAPTKEELLTLRERVKVCFEAAALATSCKIKVALGRPYFDLRQNPVLAREFETAVGRYGFDTTFSASSRASTDFGNVSYALPSLHPSFAIPTQPSGGNHTSAFTASARSEKAHEACLTVVKGLAMSGFRLLDDVAFYQNVKQAFDDSKTSH